MKNITDFGKQLLSSHFIDKYDLLLKSSDFIYIESVLNQQTEKVKPVPVPDKNEWMKGFAAACAITLLNHGEPTIVEDTYRCNFMNEKQLRNAGVEEYDIQVLLPIIKEISRKKKIK